ncbi:hypothetical protein ABXN37_15310 [Piscinibacter sakaiensis]|uniref:hypothetical protein n=1 Tax=Piscinibacter sakaiensis TaxID=1547922 RepID=UPI00372CCE96
MQAESLIEFMLGDLRRRLEPVGRLDALDSVGDRALAYYDAQNPSRLDAASLGRQARAYHLIGEIATRRGELPRAIEAFRSAAASTGALLERHPDDPQRLFDHAQSQYWVGYTARQHGNLATAEAYFLAYRELALRLVKLAPDEPNWRIEQAYAEQNLAVLLRDGGRFAEAQRAFEAAGAIWLALAAERPALAREVAQNLGFRSNVAESLGDGAAALRLQREKLDWIVRVPGAADDRQVQYLQANGQHEIARLLAATGDLVGAPRCAPPNPTTSTGSPRPVSRAASWPRWNCWPAIRRPRAAGWPRCSRTWTGCWPRRPARWCRPSCCRPRPSSMRRCRTRRASCPCCGCAGPWALPR